MTDLHCHILPAIDDGAKHVSVSMELLRMQSSSGIDRVVCTPHVDPDRQSLEDFIERRNSALKRLVDGLPDPEALAVRLKLGAEVKINPKILELDFTQLCFQQTKVLLLEMPMSMRVPWDMDVIYRLNFAGVTPLIAHIERYPYFRKDPNLALEWIEAGAYLQVNASSVLGDAALRRFVYKLIKHGMVHVIASDAHSVEHRPPRLAQAMDAIEKRFGSGMREKLERNARALYRGNAPAVEDPAPFLKWQLW